MATNQQIPARSPIAKASRPSIRNPARRCVAGVAAFVVLLACFAHAQKSQFAFDANGNLLAQSPELTASPQIIAHPQSQLVDVGDISSFLVVASGTEPLIYQWRFNGANISGATNDSLLLENIDSSDEGDFRVVVSNASGSVTSAPAFLLLDTDHDGMGDTWEFVYFGTLNRTASGDFDGDGNSNLREFQDGTDPTNENSLLFNLLVVSDGGTVIKTPDQSSYTPGQVVTLTPVPETNGAFHAWLGDVLARTNPLTLMITGDKTVYARFTPVVFTFTNLAGGDWNVASNWSPNLVPGSNDTAIITSSVIVTLDTPADCWDVVLGNGASNPTLTGTGTLKVRGNLLWTSGGMSGSGRTVIEPGGTLEIDAPAGQTPSLFGRTLENGGTARWRGGGNFGLNFGGVFTNRPDALFLVENAASITALSISSSRFDNAGTFRKSGSAGTTSIPSVTFNNYGSVEIETGALEFGGNGTHSAGSSVTGPGILKFSGGSHELAGLVNVSGSNIFSAGFATFNGTTICTNNTVIISGGTAIFNGAGQVSPAVLNLSAGSLRGTATVTVHNTLNWTGGDMSGTGGGVTLIPPGATLNISNSGAIFLNTRTVENGGTAVWAGSGNFSMNSGAVITNRPGALFDVQNAVTITANVGISRIDNAGTFRKSAGAGTTAFANGIAFNNSGAVQIQTGTLGLGGGGTHTGSFDVPAGTILLFSGGTHTANASSSITGAGQLRVSNGTVNLAGLVNVSGTNTFSGGTANFTGNTICTNNTLIISGGAANFSGTSLVSPTLLNLSLGSLGGAGTVTVLNVMNWTGGDMNGGGGGRTIIPPGATLNIANAGAIFLNTRTLENGGTAVWKGSGNLTLNSSAVITNRPGALFHVQNAVAISANVGSSRIDNAGTFRKSGNSGPTTFASSVSFNNSGTVDIRSGILAANGGYTSTASALLHTALGGITPGVGYGQLQVAGGVTLAGNLSVTLTNNFSPPANSLFTVLSAGSRNGTFASFFYPSNNAEMILSNLPNSAVVHALGPYFATTTLPDAMRNVGYTQQVIAVMNNGPIAYSLVGGALPPGLNFSGAGVISGIPTVFGESLFTVQASNSAGVIIQQDFNLRVRNQLPEGLISWWRAENNALDSIATNHGTLTNGAAFVSGNVGQAFALDGVNDYVNVPDSPGLRPSSVTLEAWAMFHSSNGPVFCKPIGATGDSYALFLLNGTLHGFIHDAGSGGVLVSSPSTLSTGQWYHVAFTFDDSSKQQALYVNGTRVATSQSNRSIGYDTHPLLLGQDINNGVFDFPLNGRIDEASIYNRALSTNEIAAIYQAGTAGKPLNAPYFLTPAQLPDAVHMVGYTQQVSAVLGSGPITFSAPSGGLPAGLTVSSNGTINGIPLVAGTHSFVVRALDSLGVFTDQLTTLRVIAPVTAPTGLISWWRAEGNALDSAGANHGTASNGVAYVVGKVGQAFGFDGINDFVWIADAPNLRPTSITLEAWAKFNGALGPVLGRSFGPAIHNSYLIWLLNGAINGTIGDTNLAADVLSVPFAPATNQWYHVAYTFDDATRQQAFYLNGEPVAFGQSFRDIGYDNHPVVIGGDIDNGAVSFLLNGGVDEAAIYSRALSASEIAAIHNAGIAGKQIPLTIPRPLLLAPEIAGSNIHLTWTTVSNATYRLEFNPGPLNVSDWIAVPGDVTAVGNTASKSDALTSSNRFYRVRLLP